VSPAQYLLWTQYRPGLAIGDSTARGSEIVIPAFMLGCVMVGIIWAVAGV
jgi:hypothetical protein